MTKPKAHTQDEYSYFFDLTTRWMDNDIYGHVNNVVYYSYFDSIVNQYLIEHGTLDIHNSDSIGLMVHSECNYHASIAFPDKIQGAFRVNRLGNSSVQYGVAIFAEGSNTASAQGTLTHVFVNRETQQAVAIDDEMREALTRAKV
jgi:acyl-CoA thioester hydrolase